MPESFHHSSVILCSVQPTTPSCHQVHRAALLAKQKAASVAEEHGAMQAQVESLRQQLSDLRAEAKQQADALRQQLSTAMAQAAATAAAAQRRSSVSGRISSTGSDFVRMAESSKTAAAKVSVISPGGRRPQEEVPSRGLAGVSPQNVAVCAELKDQGEQLLAAAREQVDAARAETAVARAQAAQAAAELEAVCDELRRERLAHPRGPAAWLITAPQAPGAVPALSLPGWRPGSAGAAKGRPATAGLHGGAPRPMSAVSARMTGSKAASESASSGMCTRPQTAAGAFNSGMVVRGASAAMAVAQVGVNPEPSPMLSSATARPGSAGVVSTSTGATSGWVVVKREFEVAPELLDKLQRPWEEGAAARAKEEVHAMLSRAAAAAAEKATAGGRAGFGVDGGTERGGSPAGGGQSAAVQGGISGSSTMLPENLLVGYLMHLENEVER